MIGIDPFDTANPPRCLQAPYVGAERLRGPCPAAQSCRVCSPSAGSVGKSSYFVIDIGTFAWYKASILASRKSLFCVGYGPGPTTRAWALLESIT
jgi:hypothetical protein